MCPNCRAFISSSDRTCPYCEQKVGPRAVEVHQPAEVLGGLIPAAHFTTVLILVINFGLFIGSLVLSNSISEPDGPALAALGGKFSPWIFQNHEYWRLVTAGFLHGGWLHILMNSWALYQLGAQTEMVYGTPRFLVIYFASSVGGFYLSAVENPGLSIGASAGIVGLIGAMVAFGVANRSSVGRAIRNSYLMYVAYIVAFSFIPGVDYWAHFGGVISGFAVGYVAGTPVHSSRAREGMWRVLATVCVLITAWSFYFVYRSFPAVNQLR
jgi:rhomboid protease GluP